jgi:hypothetical protein
LPCARVWVAEKQVSNNIEAIGSQRTSVEYLIDV